MEKNIYHLSEAQSALELNRALYKQDADPDLMMVCRFMKRHRLTAGPHIVGQIPQNPFGIRS